MALTKEQRQALPDSDFAVPGKRKLPIHDSAHCKLAWDMVTRTQGLTPSEQSDARAHILSKAKQFGIDTKRWDMDIKASAMLTLVAMSLEMPDVADHPNKMPFTGVVTFVDRPSDLAVGGSGGKLTYLPKEVAQAALPSLLGMGIDYTEDFSAHDPQKKLGVITGADIVGDEVRIEGFFYAMDFPQECARIKAEKEDLGFSYEIQAQTQAMGGNLLKIVSGTFTGAAVLYKNKAAYQSTSLAASAVKENEMTKEELQAILDAALKPLAASVEKQGTELAAMQTELKASAEVRNKIAPHAASLKNCAAAMEAAGIGSDPKQGHVKVLHHMAAAMEAEAASGRIPQIYRDHDWTFSAAADPKNDDVVVDPAVKALTDQIASMTTMVTDLKAAAFKQTATPTRSTIPAEVMMLLAKGGFTEVPKEGMTEAQVDKMLEAAGVTNSTKRIEAKMNIANAGLLIR